MNYPTASTKTTTKHTHTNNTHNNNQENTTMKNTTTLTQDNVTMKAIGNVIEYVYADYFAIKTGDTCAVSHILESENDFLQLHVTISSRRDVHISAFALDGYDQEPVAEKMHTAESNDADTPVKLMQEIQKVIASAKGNPLTAHIKLEISL